MNKTALAALLTAVLILILPVTVTSADSPQASNPTIEFSGNAGDYSAYLTWSGDGNGSPIERYEVSYSLSVSPDLTVGSFVYGSETTSCTLTGLSGGSEHLIRLTAYNGAGSTTSVIRLTPNDPDLATVTAVKNEIESSNMTIHMNLANTEGAVRDYLTSYLERYSGYEVTINEVAVTDLIPAKRKTQDDPDAPGGSFSFIVEIKKGNVRMTTKKLTAAIDNSTSVVYLYAPKYSVLKDEELVITAGKIDISSDEYRWFVSTSQSDPGELVSDTASNTFKLDTSASGEYYVRCECGEFTSSTVRITVSEPFSAVSDIVLHTDQIISGEATMLRADVFPSGATNKAVVWIIENDGGCMAALNGRTLTAYKTGTVTLKATVTGGISDGDYEKTFYVTVTEPNAAPATDTEPETTEKPAVYTESLDCSKISGIESIEITAEGGQVQITAVTKETVAGLLEAAGITDGGDNLISAVKFVYEDGAIAHRTSVKLKGQNYASVRILTFNGNGGYTLTDQTPVDGVVYGNAVSPDTVILLKSDDGGKKVRVLPYILLLAAPAAAAAVVTVTLTLRTGKKSKRVK